MSVMLKLYYVWSNILAFETKRDINFMVPYSIYMLICYPQILFLWSTREMYSLCNGTNLSISAARDFQLGQINITFSISRIFKC